MHLLIAERIIRNHPNPRAKLSELYADDPQLQTALQRVFKDFSYEQFADRTLEQICQSSPLLSRTQFACVTYR